MTYISTDMNDAWQTHNLWNYIDRDLLTLENSEEDLTEKLVQGFQAWMNDTLPSMLAEETSESFEEINKALEEFATAQLSSLTDSATHELQTALANAFQQWADSSEAKEQSPQASQPVTENSVVSENMGLSEHLIKFFQNENWPFIRIDGDSALRLAFSGKNGQWNCYAQALEAQNQIVFYSICPIPAPPATLAATAEFITRANYGLILGNFELDYTDGEIRYKTSLDAEDSPLNTALIRNLVYTNVMTCDRYLPGLLALLEQGATPPQAIHLAEQDKPQS